MADVSDLKKRIEELVPKVAAAHARQNAALADKAEADAALLVEIVETIKLALPAISGKLPEGNNERGFLLIDGKPETVLYSDGTLGEKALWLARHFSIFNMLETILRQLETQKGRTAAAEKAERHAKNVRLVLTMLRKNSRRSDK
jgi:hypothetical protein